MNKRPEEAMGEHFWTVYCDGEVVDIATDWEVAELFRIFKSVRMIPSRGLVEIVD
jgi:hypothetical protein